MAAPFYYPIFTIDDSEELESMLLSAGLGTLITKGGEGFAVTHIPFVFDPSQRLLRGHVSRRNPQSKTAAGDALVIFGGVEAYVSPAFYPSKAVHGRVAPTWNYEFLHVRGPIRLISDRTWLLRNLEELTDLHERRRADPWRVDDAPADFTEKLLSQIVGIEVVVEEIEGRRKYSQNESRENRDGVINGLKASPGLADQRLADAMATHLAAGAWGAPRK
ncbi:MAG: FMN-binding negative transcriptional regulator [Phenylobacterium sp.]|uniref:FMN-binding negative transcriptional regulator n=1 Tax=Phenylobacterium sp. TaxID=1871053 RepID=UPI003BB5A6D2